MTRALCSVLIFGALVAGQAGCRATPATWPILLEPAPHRSTWVISGARLFDSERGAITEPRDVWIEGDQILAVTDVGSPPPGADDSAPKLEATGAYLTPGLVDTHVHLHSTGAPPWALLDVPAEENLEGFLRGGVTTVFELGGFGSDTEAIAEQIEAGTLRGPRVFHTHLPITGPGGHPIGLVKAFTPPLLRPAVDYVVPQASSPADAAGLIAEALEHHADYIKLMYDALPEGTPQLSREVMKALIDEAHRQDRKVVVHIGSASDAIEAAEAGADLLAHGPYRGAVTEDEASRLAATGVPVIFTLSTWEAAASVADRTWSPTRLDRQWTRAARYENLNRHPDEVDEIFVRLNTQLVRDRSTWRGNVKRLHDAGVPIWVGTDSPVPGLYPGASLHRELAALHASGVPARALLMAATRAPAVWLQGERSDFPEGSFGVIQAGAAADLLLVDEEPLQRIQTLSEPRLIVRAGRPWRARPR